jgi:hypothetical protein
MSGRCLRLYLRKSCLRSVLSQWHQLRVVIQVSKYWMGNNTVSSCGKLVAPIQWLRTRRRPASAQARPRCGLRPQGIELPVGHDQGGATFKTIKLFPQTCVRNPESRKSRITRICPNTFLRAPLRMFHTECAVSTVAEPEIRFPSAIPFRGLPLPSRISQGFVEPLTQVIARVDRTLAEFFALENFQRRQCGAHRQAVFAERRCMYKCAWKRRVGRIASAFDMRTRTE